MVELTRRILCLLAVFVTLCGGVAVAESCELSAVAAPSWTVHGENGANWLVDPCGERFYSVGINVLDSEVPKLPLTDGRKRYEWRRFYPSLAAWHDDTIQRIRSWGFNTAGAWSLPPRELQLPEIANLELGRLARFHWFDPFDPATEQAMRALAPELVAPYKGSPYRIGYFSDNEVGWWNGALFVFYSTKPASNHTKQRWVELLRDRYAGAWEKFIADFVPPDGVSSWDALLAAESATKLRPDGNGMAAVRRFTGAVAEHYYAMTERVLREADPDALLFGDRLPIYYDPVAVRAMARHVDVIAMNYNIDSPDGWVARYFFDGLRQLTGGKPVLISEWFFAANENRSGNHNNGHLMTVGTQAERARGAAAAAVNLAAVPEIVGSHWFQYADHPTGGRADGEDYDFGLVDIDNRPYEALVGALARANDAAPAMHAAARAELAPAAHDFTIPHAQIEIAERSLAHWPKPASLVPPLTPAAGEVAFGEAYLAWNAEGIFSPMTANSRSARPIGCRSDSMPGRGRAASPSISCRRASRPMTIRRWRRCSAPARRRRHPLVPQYPAPTASISAPTSRASPPRRSCRGPPSASTARRRPTASRSRSPPPPGIARGGCRSPACRPRRAWRIPSAGRRRGSAAPPRSPCARRGWVTDRASSGLDAALRLDLARRRSRKLGQFFRRPDRAADELATAIRTPPVQDLLGASAAERAFERAHPRLHRIGRQILVAAFAIRPQLEHRGLPQ